MPGEPHPIERPRPYGGRRRPTRGRPSRVVIDPHEGRAEDHDAAEDHGKDEEHETGGGTGEGEAEHENGAGGEGAGGERPEVHDGGIVPRRVAGTIQRYTAAEISEINADIEHDLSGKAAAEINSMKSAGAGAVDKMQAWLGGKGIKLDADSRYEASHLQAMMLYWHALPERDRQQLKAAQPTFSIVMSRYRGGAHGERLSADGSITSMVRYRSILSTSTEPVPALDTDAFASKLVLGNYDGGYATVSTRRTAADLVTAPGAAGVATTPGYLIDAYAVAHEMTHLRQTHMESMYAAERDSSRDEQMLSYLVANKETDVEIIDHTPTAGGTRISPYARPLDGLPRMQDRLAFTCQDGKDLTPASNAKRSVKDAFDYFERKMGAIPEPIIREGDNNDENSPILREAVSATMKVLKTTRDKFFEVLACVSTTQGAIAPLHTAKFRRLVADTGLFLARDDAAISDLASTVRIPDIMPQDYKDKHSLREDYDLLVDSNRNLTVAENAQLKAELRDVVKQGFKALRSGLKTFELKTERSVQFANQATKRFPGLLGKLTAYSNRFFEPAVAMTKEEFAELVDDDTGAPTIRATFAPAAAMAKITEMQAKWTGATPAISCDTKAARDLIPAADWFEIGAQLGLFNNFVAEYDAESSALATLAPTELVDMYTRNNNLITPAEYQEVLNQATFILSRGIEEVVPSGQALAHYTDPPAQT